MSTNRLLNLTVVAELTFSAFADLPAYAADQKSATTAVAPVAAQPKANPQASRPLTASDVWGDDYARARQKAKALNRPVLVHFHATWCGPCQQMESTVLNTSDVLKEINSRCVAIKVDSDRYPNLVQQFGVDALPCDVLVGSDGTILNVNRGAVSADQYKAPPFDHSARPKPRFRPMSKWPASETGRMVGQLRSGRPPSGGPAACANTGRVAQRQEFAPCGSTRALMLKIIWVGTVVHPPPSALHPPSSILHPRPSTHLPVTPLPRALSCFSRMPPAPREDRDAG